MAMETQTHLLEVLQTEIVARLPLRTIFRFKSVCKTWKSTIESAYFRRLFLSLHQNSSSSSSSWSLLYGSLELIGFHGCKTWDLPKSPASLIPSSFKRYHIGDFDYVVSSGGLVLIADGFDKAYYYVGSPVLHQWVKIPPPPCDPRVGFPVFGNCVPMAMNPFDAATVYLWSQRDHHLVSCNLRKGEDYRVLEDASNDCFIDQSACKKSVDELWRPRSLLDGDEDLDFEVCIWLIQFVIPPWMESVPRPPQAEVIDTRSLLSHAAATHERMVTGEGT
ncbi:unnamed protein product [Eruca vesicaria subsp. sativa]|uniref:F-box domain-containing protein n=1 Tax=Eruca vesicaria subsp. sativa TaxID=29727 RepID=A0ABC8IP17_ERUVS|nr:unnamed protein product [Eruca vesicaria subsp. sativa]